MELHDAFKKHVGKYMSVKESGYFEERGEWLSSEVPAEETCYRGMYRELTNVKEHIG